REEAGGLRGGGDGAGLQRDTCEVQTGRLREMLKARLRAGFFRCEVLLMSSSSKLQGPPVKLSGEALLGNSDYGIDPAVLKRIAAELQEIVQMGVQVAVVIGGGNIFRGAGL